MGNSEKIYLSISHIETADKVISAFVDLMRKKDIIIFEKTAKPIKVGLILPN